MTSQRDVYADSEKRDWNSASQVSAMDNEGIDVAVLFPSRGLFTLGDSDLEPALATAISRAYNDWLADFCGGGPGRLFGAAMIPPQDVEGAVAEARRAVNELGFKSVFVRPNPVAGRNWHDPYYDPLWAEIQRLGVPLSFHEGGRVNLPQPGDNFNTHMLYHTCTHPMGMMLAVVDVVGGGVLERFPQLNVAFLEGNCSWAPWLLWRLDEHYEMSASYDHPDLKMEPSEYFRRQCYLSVECDEEPAEIVSRYRAGGQHRLLHRLPPRRLQVPAVSGQVHGAAAVRRRQAQVPVGQLRPAVRLRGLSGPRLDACQFPHSISKDLKAL